MPKVTALEDHTYNGEAYEIGDTYEAPDDLIDTLKLQGKATLADPKGAARASAKRTTAGRVTKTGRGRKVAGGRKKK